jgi:hypothetical protein
MTTLAERRHMGAVAGLGCIVCRRLGYNDTPAELHHPRTGLGMSQRAKHFNVLPLCPEHHRGKTGIHGMGSRAFSRHYGVDEAGLLDQVRQLLERKP